MLNKTYISDFKYLFKNPLETVVDNSVISKLLRLTDVFNVLYND